MDALLESINGSGDEIRISEFDPLNPENTGKSP